MGELNAWRGQCSIRGYQAAVLAGADLSVPSPFDGRDCRLEASLLLASDRIAYRFDHGNFFLLTGPQHEGYPLDRIVDPHGGRALSLGTDPAAADPSQRVEALDDHLAATLQALDASAGTERRTHALFGDGNFAHLAWNGWPALAELPLLGLDLGSVQFVSRCDPLGDPREPFPWLRDVPLDAWDDRPDLHAGRRFDRAALLGANRLPTALAARIVDLCRRRADPDRLDTCRRLGDGGRRVVWLSLRRRARDCTNQVEFLSALISQLASRRDLALILDGFSYPDCPVPDFFNDYRDRVAADQDALLRNCPELARLAGRGLVEFLNGAPLYDAIAAAGQADFYVCHGGTQQHKIGWFHAVPGVIHVPNPGPSVEQWYAEKSESALPPRCIPNHSIEVDADDAIAPPERRYRIAVEPGVDFVLRSLADAID